MQKQYFTNSELKLLGLNHGRNCKVHVTTNILNPKNLILGNDVRIDAFCNIINKKKVVLKNLIHIGPYCLLNSGGGEIKMENYSGLSAGVKIYTSLEDMSGRSFFGPHNKKKTNINSGTIKISKYSVIGANTVILPKSVIPEGCVVGANCVVNEKLKSWAIYSNNNLKLIMARSKNVKKLLK